MATAVRRQTTGDCGLALATLVWIIVLWALTHALPLANVWRASLLVAGAIGIFVENLMRSSRRG